MKTQYKIGIVAIPFLLSGLILSAMTYPKFLEDKDRSEDLTSKQQQYEQTQTKLAQRARAEKEKKTLETDIETLRGAVPKSPELDLAMIDLEKMCTDSEIQLLGVETPSQETMRQITTSETEIKELIGEQVGKVALGSKSLPKPAVSTTNGAKPAEEQPVDTGLKRLVKQVYVTGDYNGMVSLLKRLEGYQRTVGVENISIAIKTQGNEGNDKNAAAERAQKLNSTKPIMAFLMTLYYLP
ncbi:MAG TPA: hypothetical protein V6C76_13495 [Drouetiella sp.]